MATAETQVAPVDRMSFTVFVAIAVHAAVILGITFNIEPAPPPSHTMEVTLAQHQSQKAPDNADFMAQFNQRGSGDLDEAALMTTTRDTTFHDTDVRETQLRTQEPAAPTTPDPVANVISAQTTADWQAQTHNDDVMRRDTPQEAPAEQTLLQRSLDIASLEARLDSKAQVLARRPRVKRLNSLATAGSSDAFYLNSWRRKVERIGNLNYPREARRSKLYGSLRLLVAVRPDGSLKEVTLLESSGHQILDDAAIDIVKLAAPYPPFPDELRRTTDVLEIVRTWQFRKNSSLGSF